MIGIKAKIHLGTLCDRRNRKSSKKVADWCYSQRGKPYNFDYYDVNTRSKFYCSQLIWAGFKDKYNVDLNTSQYGAAVHPLEFVSSDKTMILYKK